MILIPRHHAFLRVSVLVLFSKENIPQNPFYKCILSIIKKTRSEFQILHNNKANHLKINILLTKNQ